MAIMEVGAVAAYHHFHVTDPRKPNVRTSILGITHTYTEHALHLGEGSHTGPDFQMGQ